MIAKSVLQQGGQSPLPLTAIFSFSAPGPLHWDFKRTRKDPGARHLIETFMKSSSLTDSVSHDHPDVIIFPPLLPLGGLALGFILQHFFPLSAEPDWLFGTFCPIAASILVGCGLGLMIASRTAMMRAGTNVSPRRPVLHLVAQWPFTWSRNPMYLGGNLALLGLGLAFRLPWVGVLFPFLIAICHYGVVLREEQYLERKFGRAYLDYKTRVRRWL
jgi:protein-S-isoprenylcysteine O-methyltransferase Ste14